MRPLPTAVLLALALPLAACRGARNGADVEPGPISTLAMRCVPGTPGLDDTVEIALPEGMARELSIEAPDGTFFQLVNRDPLPDMGPQLLASDSLFAARRLQLTLRDLVGLPYVYQARDVVPIFVAKGRYRIRVAERLNTDDGTPVAVCELQFRGRGA